MTSFNRIQDTPALDVFEANSNRVVDVTSAAAVQTNAARAAMVAKAAELAKARAAALAKAVPAVGQAKAAALAKAKAAAIAKAKAAVLAKSAPVNIDDLKVEQVKHCGLECMITSTCGVLLCTRVADSSGRKLHCYFELVRPKHQVFLSRAPAIPGSVTR